MKRIKVLFLCLIITLCVVVGFTTGTIIESVENDVSNSVVESINNINHSEIETLKYDTIENNIESIITENTAQRDGEKTSPSVSQHETEVVSQELLEADDISIKNEAVMSEIAKYVETSIDFKFNKQESIKGKAYNLTFSEIENIIENDEKVVYKNELEDIFKYDAKSGKLREAIINSVVTQKTNESINENTAKKLP